MIYLVGPPLLLVSIVLLLFGVHQDKPWALYLLKASWIAGLLVAFHFTIQAWQGSAYSENWEMIGVIIFVWPITGFVAIFAAAEIFMLRRRRDRHARICRFLAITISSLLLVLSLSAVIVDAW
ncbi:MAG: hypothetical protein K9J74_14280 [Sulfuritalea sp.]|nr:hypothetical protein [Sulfuritalea sp.]